MSYARADRVLKAELVKHLEPLERLKLIEVWSDTRIMPGDHWEQEISAGLEVADIILLLVSVDFLSSRYCYEVELERALERHSAGGAVVVPVILRPCLWKHASFAHIQVLPSNGVPVTSWASIDEAMTNVAEGVREVVERVLNALSDCGTCPAKPPR